MQPVTGNSRWVLLFSLFFVPLIAWLGPLEKLSYDYLDQSLASAGLIYGTARGINAAVSVLQTTELDAAIVSMQVGQILDPVNDLIERFSGVMLVALGSLALQKILLELVSDTFFTATLTLLAVLSAGTLLAGEKKYCGYLIRGFWVTVVLRFSLVIVVLLNSWVDAAFLQESEAARHQEMSDFQASLEAARSGAVVDEAALAELRSAALEIETLETQRSALQTTLGSLQTDLTGQEAILTEARKESTQCKVLLSSTTCSPGVLEQSDRVDAVEEEIEHIETLIAPLDERIADLNESVECLDRRSMGKGCGIFDSVTSTFSLEKNIGKLEEGMADFVDSTVDLLMSLLFKTVLIPLGFLYCVLKALAIPWSRISARPQQPQAEAMAESP